MAPMMLNASENSRLLKSHILSPVYEYSSVTNQCSYSGKPIEKEVDVAMFTLCFSTFLGCEEILYVCGCICVCVCMREREREIALHDTHVNFGFVQYVRPLY